jgi:homoserine O-succinyltransferase
MLTIGLLNNMPAAAVPSTERQFVTILTEAAKGLPLCLRWFRLSGARPEHYERLEDLWAGDLDGLIVTGAEPKAAVLTAEPFWQPLARTIAWAGDHTRSTIFSCLAAHAAVLHLDGIERRMGADKIFGLFGSVKTADHALVADLPPVWKVPHSRWNDLPEADLLAHGYDVLAKSTDAGVDLFVKQVKQSLFVFIQTHPEYDVDSLMREWRRDVARFHAGQQDYAPHVPRNYFDNHSETDLAALRIEMIASRGSMVTPRLERSAEADGWFPVAVQLYRNWLLHLDRQMSGHNVSHSLAVT